MIGERPRVRHLVKGLGPGGAERLVVTQATGGSDDAQVEYDVVYLLAHKDHLVPELRTAGVEVRCLDARGSAHPGWMLRLRTMLRDDPVDVVHVHSPLVAAVVRVLVRTLGRSVRPAVVGTEHNRWPRHRRPTRLANRLTIRWQDATVAVSTDVRSTMSRGARERTQVVVHGIDLGAVRASGDRSSARRDLGISDDEILVVCVANLRPEKALDVLIRAAEGATAAAAELHYALVGQGPRAGEIAELIAGSSARGRISLLGYRTDATRVVSGADVFTLSSRHEGLPVAVMEALALGVPVVATAAGGVPEAIADAGITVPIDDPDALARAHLRLARDEQLRADLGQRARQRSEAFSATRARAELESLYREVLARRSRETPSSQS